MDARDLSRQAGYPAMQMPEPGSRVREMEMPMGGKKGVVALYFHRLAGVGGAQRMVCLLADALVARGFTVHLISWDQPHSRPFYSTSSEVKLHCLGFSPGLVGKVRRSGAFFKLLHKYGVNILIGFVMSGDRTVLCAAKLAGTKVIAAERNAPAMYALRYNWIQRWLGFASLHLVDKITVQFPEFVHGYPGKLHDRIEVIANPVATSVCRARPQRPGPNGRFTIIAVSRLDTVQKRLHKLVEAFALVADAHPAWDLLIVGDGPDETSLQQLAQDRGIAGRVHVRHSTRQISRLYASAHLFAIPSRWEGFSNALAEALAHGLPAVGFRGAPGVAQLIIDGETGWLAEGQDDEQSFAKALDEAMASGSERARRAANAVKRMTNYEPEAQFDRWANLIRATTDEL